MTSPHLLVLDPGMASSVQDAGRIGYRRFGVSVSGAVDVVSMTIANRLVGNGADEATVEMTLTGGCYRVESERCRIAVAGADMPVSVDGTEAPNHAALDLVRRDELRIGKARAGTRAYLAVSGGFAIAPMLGSCSTHVRSRLGGIEGRLLQPGDALPLASDAGGVGAALGLPLGDRPDFGGPIRVILGPQADAFTEAGLSTFLACPYTISGKSDRMGCQLEGPPIEHRDGFNIISDGVTAGSIQVPGHGLPLLLLADCQTTGGYPKIATVVSADLHKLGQRRPGDQIAFVAVDDVEAGRLRLALRRFLEAASQRFTEFASVPRLPSVADLLSNNLVSGVVTAHDPLVPQG